MTPQKARLAFSHGGRVAVVTLAAPKGNILDREMIAALVGHIDALAGRDDLVALVIVGEGPHFSFGASVEEHLPDHIVPTLDALHGLLRKLLTVPMPTIAAVRGQCLGGGLELVLACDLVIAEEGAQFACPEIKLGVFPPAASVLLPVRIGGARAAALALTGDSIGAQEARTAGLVAKVAPDGQLEQALDAWLAESFVPRSPIALRCAAKAIRREAHHAAGTPLADVERIYLDRLMQQPDAVEGITAFLEKRAPRWAAKVSS